MFMLHLAALAWALVVTPWTLAGWTVGGSAGRSVRWVHGSLILIALNTGLPVALHLAGIPLRATPLAMAHLALGIPISLFSGLRKRRDPPPGGSVPQPLWLLFLLFAVLVIPFGHIAGIDTYKWQDLASSVAVEEKIAWLTHPLSLLGFTPRSYPSAQPLLLATIEMLGHTGIDWGFYLLSLLMGATGLAGAWHLGKRLFADSSRGAGWYAFLYVFSPLFMRYNFWATGRGMLLALLPAYLLLLTRLLRPPSGCPPRRGVKQVLLLLATLPGLIGLSLLLSLSHKAGLVAAFLIPCLVALSPAIALFRNRVALLVLLLATLAAGALLTGSPLLLAWRHITRFGWLLPLACVALAAYPTSFASPLGRAMLTGALALFVLSSTPDMYGALLALPFITYLAVAGLDWIEERLPARTSSRVMGSLTVATAVIFIINQSGDSPSRELYRAACFLEAHDPKGPFLLEGPGRSRAQVQAYVSGCPRFSVTQANGRVSLRPPPALTGNPRHDARKLVDYLRDLFEVDSTTDWYGGAPRLYSITIAGEGRIPSQARLIYSDGPVRLFESDCGP